ncbi:hypothetical protein [Campylobacter armoricus]|uniref:hypothetical protein n=1 Tax=Campylobacter armoricus TaxID=2505970 RepID=UPI001F44C281|nr:hypothetical protein [Campylobacter armoricus]
MDLRIGIAKNFIQSNIDIFIFLHGREQTYFNYLNFISNLNSNEKQKYLNLRASTKDLEKQIFEEKLKFIKHYEEFYDYLDSIGYLNKGSWYKAMAIYPKITIRGLLLFHNNQLCSSKDTNFIFQNMKENYNIFNNLDPNSSKLLDKTLGKEWKDYRKNVSIFIEDTINKIQKALDECK